MRHQAGLAADLRGRYTAITPGYHLNKRHWNTVALDGSARLPFGTPVALLAKLISM